MNEEQPARFAPTMLDPHATPSGKSSLTWVSGLPPQLPTRFGHYELQKLLGKGGMGAVYLARDLRLNRLVALKIPNLTAQDTYQLKDRFLREAHVAAQLSHANLCPVYDCGQVEGVLYLTMAYLEGKPLARFIQSGKQLPPRAVVVVVRQLALAMQAAHEKGVIHRDLKPSNIMITPKKQAVIMDFGLARRTDAEDSQITYSGQILGTPAYMSPEQLNSDASAMGPASDVYGLGIILYELLAGRPPFEGGLGTLMARIMTEPPPPLSRWHKNIDPVLDAICQRALAKKPGDRFPSMQAFAAALDDYLRGRYKLPEPVEEEEPISAVDDEDAPLDENDPASLFRVMAARQDRAAARPGHRPASETGQRRRRRRRFRLPEWVIPVVAAGSALIAVAYVLHYFYQYLDQRRPLPDLTVVEEQRQQQQGQKLAGWLARASNGQEDVDARRELEAWLNGPAGKRTDLPPEVNLGLGQYLIVTRDPPLWDAGLRRLRLGSQGSLRQAAEEDLSAVAGDSSAKLRSGDTWWHLSSSPRTTDRERVRYRERAAHWYRQALPDLNGADRSRVEERLQKIG
jgi:serine/threonine protein kinase